MGRLQAFFNQVNAGISDFPLPSVLSLGGFHAHNWLIGATDVEASVRFYVAVF